MSFREERRADPRVRVKVRVGLEPTDDSPRATLHTLDLSMGGCQCVGRALGETGAAVIGKLFLPLSEGGRDKEVEVAFEACILRNTAVGHGPGNLRQLALSFTRIADLDRDELRRYLLEWLAVDSLVRDSLVETA